MPIIKKINDDFKLENNRIILSQNYLTNNVSKFKKITGTRLSAILNKSSYNSPVKMWAQMVNIYSEPMDPMYAEAGNIIEPKIHQWVCQKTGINFKQHNPFECKWDVFSDNKIFGGIPDGEPIDENGNYLYPSHPILEIKTSSIDSFKFKKENGLFVLLKDSNNHPIVKNKGEKKQKWFTNDGNIVIPDEYKYQLGLYCFLRNTTKGIFAVAFLETDDYIKPQFTNINNREIYLVDFKINIDIFKKEIKEAEKWYEEHILKGISPELTKEDFEWFNAQINTR